MMSITVSCHVVIKRQNEVLLIKRADFGLWSTPGGRVEDNETFEQAAVREIEEECGIRIKVDGVCGLFSNTLWDRGIHTVVFAAVYQGELPVKESDEATEIAFHDIDNLPRDILYWHIDYIKSAYTGDLLRCQLFNARSPGMILKRQVDYSGVSEKERELLRREYLKAL